VTLAAKSGSDGHLVLGVDSSTQSTTVEARRVDDGAVVATTRAAHPPTSPPISEQDPRSWWTALVEAVTALGDRRHRVVAISVAGQQHGLVLVGSDGEPVRPAPLWNDTTAAKTAADLISRAGAGTWATGCGSVPLAAFTVAKLAHLLMVEPAVMARVAKVFLPHDYLTWRLTGAHVTDRGDASGTGWFDPAGDTYRPDLLAIATDGDDRWTERLPRVLAPTEVAGELTTGAADALGLSPGVTVGPGTGDNMAAALGLGLQPGDGVISLGTSGTVYSVSTTPTADPSGIVAGFADATGRFLPLVCTLNATKVTDTVARWLRTDPAGLAALALECGPAPIDAVVVPWFDGERTPNRPEASGSMLGLRPETSPAELARAAHDGVLCGLLDGLDALQSAGVEIDGRLSLVGGGARSVAYRQRAADLSGRPVRIPDADEAVATGAAVQAAAVHGSEDLGAVADRWALSAGTVVDPDPAADRFEVRARYAAAIGSIEPS
jgi:xylulokinase